MIFLKVKPIWYYYIGSTLASNDHLFVGVSILLIFLIIMLFALIWIGYFKKDT